MRTLFSALLIATLAMAFSFGEATAAVDKDVVLAMPFEEGKGEVTKDLSPHGNDGTLKAAKWEKGKFGQALMFDGTARVDVADDDSLDLIDDTDFTIAVWANFGAEQSLTFVGKDEGDGETDKWMFMYKSPWHGDHLQFHINWPDKGGVWIGTTKWSAEKGKWYQIVLSKKKKNYTFYIDGKKVDEASNDAEISNSDTPLTIGWSEGPTYFVGLLDEVLIVKRALSEAEILNHFKGGVTGILAVQSLGKLATTWGDIKIEASR